MNAHPIYVFAKWQVKEGNLQTVLQLLEEVAKKSRKEEGNLTYEAHSSLANENTILLYEGYKNEQAIEAHRNADYFQNVVIQQIVPLLENREVVLANRLAFD